MQLFWPVNWIYARPSSVACVSLILILALIPERCEGGKGGGGKKRLGPVKHLFGIGIGYQKVVHYKPVLVFSKHHKRPKIKHRRPGWGKHSRGWSSPPVIVQHHIYKSANANHHRHGDDNHGHYSSYRKRKKTHSHHPHQHRNGGWSQSYRGWGWKPLRKTTHPHHNLYGGNESEYDIQHTPEHSPPHRRPSSGNDFVGGGDFHWKNSPVTHSYGNPYAGPGTDYVDEHGGYESETQENWNKHNKQPLAPLVFPGTTKSNSHHQMSSAPVVHGEGESPPPSSKELFFPSPPIYPFEDSPKTDGNVANIRRDFLKTHLKNFREFQGYQQHHPPNNNNFHYDPMMRPPGPDYTTTNDNNNGIKDSGNSADIPYYDDYYNNPSDEQPNHQQQQQQPNHNHHKAESPSSNQPHYTYDDVDDDGFNWTELNRKMMPSSSAITQGNPPVLHPTQAPVVYGTPAALPSNQNPVIATGDLHHVQSSMQVNGNINGNSNLVPPPGQNGLNTFFKPSPKMDDMGNGAAFSDPGFFPSFDQFKNTRMDK